ncbi:MULTISPECIES: hypothetical protein [Exiguobacterium]|uniref:hypothetical protein n=1 Tax=Exiguobacterium TaxID=33986 RepID=UPI001BE695B4|nr:hypothetical protein [Exiguobacterium artemiae]MCT4793456.1 hypothetical protein [Exiguobacterium artemiae]
MRFRSRLLILIGVVILGLGIIKPLAEAGYGALQNVEVFPGGGQQPSCVSNCESEPLTFWWSYLFKKKELPPGQIKYGYETDEPGEGGGKPEKEKFISLGFHSFAKGEGEEGEKGFPYLLVATGLAGVILLFLIGRRFRKRKKWNSAEEGISPRSVRIKKRLEETNPADELPPLPVEQVRQQVVLFNRHLPQKLKRRETESFREWFARIGFQPSPELQQLYETVRYDPNRSSEMTKTVLTDIEQDFSAYLGQLK